jgi:hypothetical protein
VNELDDTIQDVISKTRLDDQEINNLYPQSLDNIEVMENIFILSVVTFSLVNTSKYPPARSKLW